MSLLYAFILYTYIYMYILTSMCLAAVANILDHSSGDCHTKQTIFAQ